MPNAIVDLIKTKGNVWWGLTSATTPDENTAMASATGFTSLGWTQEGVQGTIGETRMSFMVDDLLAPIDERKIETTFTISTVLAEVNADNLAMALGGLPTDVVDTAAGASQVAFSEYFQSAADPLVSKLKIVLEGTRYDATDAPFPIRIILTRATIKIDGDLEFKQRGDSYMGVPILITGLVDTANSNKLFTYQFVTAAASS